jgi:hypothetical protein
MSEGAMKIAPSFLFVAAIKNDEPPRAASGFGKSGGAVSQSESYEWSRPAGVGLRRKASPSSGDRSDPVCFRYRKHLLAESCLQEMRLIKPEMFIAWVAGPHMLLQREPGKVADIVSTFMQNLKI